MRSLRSPRPRSASLAACLTLAGLAGCDAPPTAPPAPSGYDTNAPDLVPDTSAVARHKAPSGAPPTPPPPAPGAAASHTPADEPPPPDDAATSFARVRGPISPAPGPAPTGGFNAEARRCLTEPSCPMERYAALTFAAVDADEAGVSCLDLVRGSGLPVDLSRARRCLKLQLGFNPSCERSSPSLERLQLALLAATGRGGPRSSQEAAAALEGCFQDGSVQAMDEVFAKLAKGENPNLKSVELCAAELAMTTLHMTRCEQQDEVDDAIRERALEKALFAKSDRETVERFRLAGAKFDAYRGAMADNAGDLYRGGTLSVIQWQGATNFAQRQRLARWELYLRGKPRTFDDAAAKQARSDVLAEKERTRTQGDVIWRNLFHAMDKAYGAWRADEAKLAKSLPGATARDVEAALDADWTEELRYIAGPDH